MSRVLGIDLGTRRIGVAVSDGLRLTAQPLDTLLRHGGRRDVDAISALVKKHEVSHIVVGLPDNPLADPGASESPRNRTARLARAFAARLEADLGLPVALIDESFSTVEAEDLLITADLSRNRRRQVVDRVAAAIILQRWLDAAKARQHEP